MLTVNQLMVFLDICRGTYTQRIIGTYKDDVRKLVAEGLIEFGETRSVSGPNIKGHVLTGKGNELVKFLTHLYIHENDDKEHDFSMQKYLLQFYLCAYNKHITDSTTMDTINEIRFIRILHTNETFKKTWAPKLDLSLFSKPTI
jgi:hypothetical protein